MPPGDRKSGMPAPVETPAPVRKKILQRPDVMSSAMPLRLSSQAGGGAQKHAHGAKSPNGHERDTKPYCRSGPVHGQVSGA